MTSDNKKSNLPLDKYPEWNNDQRMNALFAPFRTTGANSADQLSKCEFWKKFIQNYLKNNGKCSFRVSELEVAFERNNCRPQCLAIVTKDMIKSGDLVLESDFKKPPNSTWGSWMVNAVLKKSVTFPYILVKNYLVEDNVNPDARYVSLQIVKHLSNSILDSMDESTDNKVFRFKDFMSFCKSTSEISDESTAKLVLIHLSKSKNATIKGVTRDKQDLLVKVSRSEAHEITDTEVALDFLSFQEETLIKDIESLELKKEEITQKAKGSLKNNLRQAAKSLLRKKQEIEKNIENRSNALMNIQKLEAKINDAKAGKGVLEGYKTARDALKKFETDGLTEKTVEEAMDSLAEVLGEVEDIETFISEPVSSDITDLELEEELEELLKQEEENEIVSELPDLADLSLKELSSNLVGPTMKSPPPSTTYVNKI